MILESDPSVFVYSTWKSGFFIPYCKYDYSTSHSHFHMDFPVTECQCRVVQGKLQNAK
eukprot:m.344455 g.344455  ORF g.344455 m.344455 type:complete len:58 (-) comp24477_c0_seq1:3752-3925(-)